MSRYYKIVVGEGDAATTWTNMAANGGAILNAQTVELDLLVAPQHVPDAGSLSFVRVWGPTRDQISQAQNFNGKAISVYGGMQAGLPLASADATQSGLLITGTIFAGFGNWQGINQTLDFVINPNGDAPSDSSSVNIVHYWLKGTPLATALKATLGAAFPGWTIPTPKISPDLVLSSDDHGVYDTLAGYADYIQKRSKSILGETYDGVYITTNTGSKTIAITDNSTNPTDVTAIDGDDLIGQITWLDLNTISFVTVMRSDLQISDSVSFPKYVFAQAQTSSSSDSQARNSVTFTGNFGISRVQHFGNSRDPDAQSWVSSFQAYAINPDDSGGTAPP